MAGARPRAAIELSASRHGLELTLRVVIVSQFLAGSQFAHAINTVKIAHSFARLGHEVTIICRKNRGGPQEPEELALLYGLDTPLHWKFISRKWGGRSGWKDWYLALRVIPAILCCRPHLVYARDFAAPALASRLGITSVLESHAYPKPEAWPSAFNRTLRAIHLPAFRTWITISQRLADRYRSLGADANKLLVLPGAVDLAQFTPPETSSACPYKCGGPRVVYAGHLYDYKGIPTVLAAARQMSEVVFHLIGGWPDDVERQRVAAKSLGLENVVFHGLLPQAKLPPYLWHADVLLLPPSADHPSAAWTSPVKMGEYLAAKVPVVASSVPALRDWLDDTQVEFFTPDDADSLAAALRRVLNDSARRSAMIGAAWKRVQKLSYEYRAQEVLRHAGLVKD